jgi:DNA sulfur modification protein DndB
METVTFSAFSIGKDDIECYVTVMSAKEMVKIATVSRIDEDAEKGYQRHLDQKRVKEITSYINDGNIIPGSIILSVQKGCSKRYDEENGKLHVTLSENNLLFVIDGQHRLYGASLCEQDVILPVCIFTGLDIKQEIQYFLDINSYQRGVTKTLRIELLKFLAEPDSRDDIRNRLFKELNTDLNSPLYNRMSPTISMEGKLTHVPFQEAIDPLLNGNILKQFNYEGKKTLIVNYLLAVESTLKRMEGNSNRITNSIFFQAIFKIFDEVCSLSLTHYKNYKEESFTEILDAITRLDFTRHTGSNNQVKNAMIKEMKDLLAIKSNTLGVPDDLLF